MSWAFRQRHTVLGDGAREVLPELTMQDEVEIRFGETTSVLIRTWDILLCRGYEVSWGYLDVHVGLEVTMQEEGDMGKVSGYPVGVVTRRPRNKNVQRFG